MWTLHQLAKRKDDNDSTPTSPSSSRTGSPHSPKRRKPNRGSSPTGIIRNPAPTERATPPSEALQSGSPVVESEEEDIKPAYTRFFDTSDDSAESGESLGPWGFSKEEVTRWPALKKRNFWCIQRHSATAMHYDLRMQLDSATVSWAVPKGLLGLSRSGEANRMAVETSLHPISYTTYEGSDGRTFSLGRRGGTLLWDVGEYIITHPTAEHDSDTDDEATYRRKKRGRPVEEESPDDPDGRHQEDKFRQALYRNVGYGKSRSIHFILKGGEKMTDHHYILILAAAQSKASTFDSTGRMKKTWFISMPRGVDNRPWDKGGEEGDFYGRSVKSGRTLKEVCEGRRGGLVLWNDEKERFSKWFGRDQETE
ncbi:hypothetical protein CI109_102680 [Kwoniella shandongensis]|uniref:Uncharacterized protein n=1 Tax=Kwoniella shandongensis TaxID=1734106 RepID=A0A5M6BPA9_9TREE|nr:uncharacterized protein CI109_007120 [Kwoniella shandongensis]KAA5524573.1 hypothetical protein CI109_007120 [Kwoniella shandongensis]